MASVNETTSDAASNSPPLETDDHCAVCNKSPAQQCTQCRSCSYCSTECQRANFASHNLLCKQLVTLPPRSTPEHKRAIVFPESEINPRIVWIKCTANSMGDVYYEWIDVSPYLGHKKSGKFYAPRKNNHVSLIARDDFLSDGSSINKSIIATAGPSMARPLAFRGPMVAIREVDYDTYCDITLADFWCLSEYLRCYGVTASAKPATSPSSFGEGVLSPLSVRLGMPIRIWKYPNANDYAGAFNPNAFSLLREIDPIHPLFGHPHPYWDSGIGDVLAVREDGQDLSVQDVRVMCGFGAILYCDMVINVMAGNNMAGKRRISESVTCESMAKRWREGDDCMYAE